MRNNINEVKAGITIAEAFAATYGSKLGELCGWLYCNEGRALLAAQREDAALLGEVFARSGWVRKLDYGASISWNKEVDGVKIVICDAETLEMNDTPVPEKAFPLLLEESK